MTIRPRIKTWLASHRWPAAATVIAVALAAPSLWGGFASDDYVHRAVLTNRGRFPYLDRSPLLLFSFIDGVPEHNRRAIEEGVLPWWTYERLRAELFRPVTAATHWLDYRLWPDTPALMHAHSLVWFAAAVFLAATLYRRILGPGWVAGLAGLFFAMDEAHALPAGWLANRNAATATAFALAALLAHDQWRRRGSRAAGIAAPILLGLGLLSGETALAGCGYLLAYALFLESGSAGGGFGRHPLGAFAPAEPGGAARISGIAPAEAGGAARSSSARRRLASLTPAACVTLAWAVGYKLGGFGTYGSGAYIDPGGESLRFIGAALRRGPVLLLGQFIGPPSDLFSMASEPAQRGLWIGAILIVAALAALAAATLRRDPKARFFALGALLAAIPICGTFPSDRLLFLVGFGGMGLVAMLVAALGGSPVCGETPPGDRREASEPPASACAKPVAPGRDHQGAPPLLRHGTGVVIRDSQSRRHIVTRMAAAILCIVHGVAAPLLLPFMVLSPRLFSGVLERAAASVPRDEAVVDQTVVVVQSISAFASTYSFLVSALNENPAPRRVYVLASGIYPTQVQRVSERTLSIRPAGGFYPPAGYVPPPTQSTHADAAGSAVQPPPAISPLCIVQLLDVLFRADVHPLRPGDTVELDGLRVRIMDLAERGNPAEAAFDFDVPLEDSSLRWLIWQDGEYVPYAPPRVGETHHLPAPTLPF